MALRQGRSTSRATPGLRHSTSPRPTFGVLQDFRQRLPHGQGYGEFYDECLSLVRTAEGLDYSTVWLSEHHFTDDGFLPSPLVMAAAIARETDRIRIGTNILILPLHHPLRVAEDGAVVDLLSGGRLVLAVGQGYAPGEFKAFDVDLRSRPRRLSEGVQIIRRAWEHGRIGFAGEQWQFDDAPFSPRPERRIPIYFGAVSRKAVERAAGMADGLVVYCGPSGDLAPRARLLAEVLSETETPRDRFAFVATGILHVHEDGDRAWDEAAPGIAYLEREIGGYGGDQPEAAPAATDLRREDFLVGTPDEVAERLQALHDDCDFDHFAFWSRLPGLTLDQAVASLRLFAHEVKPRVRARPSHA